MFDKLDDWLVEGWRSCWRWWSVWANTLASLAVALFGAVATLPGPLEAMLPAPYRPFVAAAWWSFAMFLRLKRQGGGNASAR